MAKTSFSVINRPDPADLLGWYDRHARDLPWRSHQGRAPSPYHTWLSEIMLQQTTVATVIPYYLRFISRWPNVAALAAADEQEVLHEWAGLGYYSRARNLLACAKEIVTQYGGEFPDTIELLKKLPGIGDYTANAIRTIAFDLSGNVVDGNVERVVSRIYAFDKPMNIPQHKKELRALAATLLPDKRHGDYAQALMDLGATICTPRNPLCHACPWQKNCQAFASGRTAEIPFSEKRGKTPQRYMACFVLYDTQNRLLLRQRPQNGLLGGLWECPSTAWVEYAEDETAFLAPDQLPRNLPQDISLQHLPQQVVHVFSHFKLTADIFIADKALAIRADHDHDHEHQHAHQKALDALSCAWFTLDALPPLSTLSRKIIDRAAPSLLHHDTQI